MDKKNFEIVETQILYQGMFKLLGLHLRHRLFNGTWSDTFFREVMERPPAVAVLPYDPILDHVILIEQFRPGALHHPGSPWQIEIPAGLLEIDEKPEAVAIREAEEEAGCKIANLQLIYEYFSNSAGSTAYIYIFYAEVNSSEVNGIHGLPEEHEDIRVINIPAQQAFTMLKNNEIKNPPAIIALQWLQLNKIKHQR